SSLRDDDQGSERDRAEPRRGPCVVRGVHELRTGYSITGSSGAAGAGGGLTALLPSRRTAPTKPTMIAPRMPSVAKPQAPTIRPEPTLATADVLQMRASDTP